jgi:hypothetical protein
MGEGWFWQPLELPIGVFSFCFVVSLAFVAQLRRHLHTATSIASDFLFIFHISLLQKMANKKPHRDFLGRAKQQQTKRDTVIIYV